MTESEQCPPHYWFVTIVRIDGLPHNHHQCTRCGAQKDVPDRQPGSRWPAAGRGSKRKGSAEMQEVRWTNL